MCRNKNKTSQSPRYKFYSNLRGFFIFNLIMIVLYVTGNGFDWFWKISAFWSIGLVIGYVKAFGMPGANGWLSDDWQDWMAEREARRAEQSASFENNPGWKDKDLV